jgi:hypothetical protein
MTRRRSEVQAGGAARQRRSARRGLAALALAALLGVSTSGCALWVGYCMATSGPSCGKGDPEWGAGTTLIEGRSLFVGYFDEVGVATWRFDNDVLIASAGRGHVVTRFADADVVLRLTFAVADGARAALVVRATDPAVITPRNAIVIPLSRGTGVDANVPIGGVGSALQTVPPIGRVSVLDVIAKGPRIVVKLDGTTVETIVEPATNGRIALTFEPAADGRGTLAVYRLQRRSLRSDE